MESCQPVYDNSDHTSKCTKIPICCIQNPKTWHSTEKLLRKKLVLFFQILTKSSFGKGTKHFIHHSFERSQGIGEINHNARLKGVDQKFEPHHSETPVRVQTRGFKIAGSVVAGIIGEGGQGRREKK